MQQPDPGPQPSPPPQPPSAPPGFGPPPPPYAPPGQPYAPPPQPYAPPPAQPPQAYGSPPPPPYDPSQPYAPYPAPQPSPPDGPSEPEFLAVDRHNSIVVDSSGVSFDDHGLGVDFSWPEIRSVHYKPSTNNKGLVMGVAHVDGRFYECVVDAKRHDRLQQWFAQLLPVLQYYRPMG